MNTNELMPPEQELEDPRGDGWFVTRSGNKFFPLHPRVGEVLISDVAFALSNISRFGGHVDFYCPTPDQRILTEDLRWVPAGELAVGSKLFSFDENPTIKNDGKRLRRRLRPSMVTNFNWIERPIILLELSDGSVIRASSEHPWLTITKASGNQIWRTSEWIASKLEKGGNVLINKFLNPWPSLNTRSSGWLAGIMDGEGHVCFDKRAGVACGIAQNEGPILDQIQSRLIENGFTKWSKLKTSYTESSVHTIQLTGGWPELVRLVGSVRPERLISKIINSLHNGTFQRQLHNGCIPLRVVKAYREKKQWCAGIETSTHTYFCEGFAAHNSVAEHCCIISDALPAAYKLLGLMHDATEAYLGDCVRPLKHQLPQYKQAEDHLWLIIAEQFGLPSKMPPIIKEYDNRALLAERNQLMPEGPNTRKWYLDFAGIQPLNVRINCWPPIVARREFMKRYEQLTKQ